MSYKASDLIPIMQACAESTIGNKKSSFIVYGTVTAINPLRIQLDGHEKPMREDFFHLTPFVKICLPAGRRGKRRFVYAALRASLRQLAI
ncbi:MAG: DUF2577 domain-containing protein [Firmicutes bacterium]|nr:DUF2577 domain-containing protein [Bacillota bacterium]